MKQNKLIVQNLNVSFKTIDNKDFISLTDIARSKNPDEPKDVVKNWLRSKSTIEFLGLWETINNENFKGVEFDSFKKEAGANSFTLSPTKWIENATTVQLVVLANLENLNSEYIKQNIQSDDRLIRLNKVAIEQLNLLIKQYNKLESK